MFFLLFLQKYKNTLKLQKHMKRKLLLFMAFFSIMLVSANQNFMTFTTSQNIGSVVTLSVKATQEDQSSCWIDLNNNGVEDGDEAISFSDDSYYLGSQTVFIYGNVTSLNINRNMLSSLDVSHNSSLEYLYCDNNELTSLDVSENLSLKELSFTNNALTSLDVSNNSALVFLCCAENQLTSLDISNNLALTKLYCWANQLTSLDVSHNWALKDISCAENQFTSLDVSSNPALRDLTCTDNQLTSLDVTSNLVLEKLNCNHNLLTSLDVSKNSELLILSCSSNRLKKLNLANGNNANMSYVNLLYNNELECAQIDPGFTPPNSWGKSNTTNFSSTSCVSNTTSYDLERQKTRELSYRVENNELIVESESAQDIMITTIEGRFIKNGYLPSNEERRFVLDTGVYVLSTSNHSSIKIVIL